MGKQLKLQGPRPAPLVVSKESMKIKKPSSLNYNPNHHDDDDDDDHHQRRGSGPVIVYLKSPDVIHVRPEEFMGLVQRLTGKPAGGTATVPDDDGIKKGSTDLWQDGLLNLDNDDVQDSEKLQRKFDSGSFVACPAFSVNIYTEWRN